MAISGRFYPQSPIDLQVSCYGWSHVLQKDVLTGKIELIFWLPVSGNTGKEFSCECSTPQSLWEMLQDLTADPLDFFKKKFDYTPPAGGVSSLPANLSDLFN